MAISFPSNPTIGDEFSAGGFTWVWSGSSWDKVAASVSGVTGDFVLRTTSSTTYTLERPYSAGRYTLTFSDSDTSYDIYAVAEDGTPAGYTNNGVLEASQDFTKVVVFGAANNVRILFTYAGAVTASTTSGDAPGAGPFLTSVVTSSLPNINDTTVINGGNFATNVTVSFTGQNAVELSAKNVVRSSSTQLIVTRPDALSVAQSPYTVKVTNPGITSPSTNVNILTNAVTAGTNPTWVTGSSVIYNTASPTSITLLATDTEGSDIDYSVVSGTLPAGLSLNSETGVISGTFSGTAAEGDSTSVTFRAVDAGGNFVDKAISMIANANPVWSTAGNGLPANFVAPSTYSFQLVANTGTQGGALTYSLLSGELPGGLTLSSAGLISGSTTETAETTDTFTVRVQDANGAFSDRTFTLNTSLKITATGGTKTTSGGYVYHQFTSSGSFVISSGSGTVEVMLISGGAAGQYVTGGVSPGGGGGGSTVLSTTVASGSYPVVVGAGGGGSGSPSSFNTSLTVTAASGTSPGLNGGAGATSGSTSGGNGNNLSVYGWAVAPEYAGGGGGPGNYSYWGNGGLGGGGKGAGSTPAGSGTPGLGGGGGGGEGSVYGYGPGGGGSGQVIVRYVA